ncbi:MAG: Rqc2 family fibronectin-binding protein [Bradymonadaceae bacterium]
MSRREIELLLEEIAPALEVGGIQKVFEVDPRHFILQVRVPGQTHYLFVGLEPGHGRLHFVPSKTRQPTHPAPFTMLLRKWVQGALIEKVEQTRGDRIVTLYLSSIDPDWDPEPDDKRPAPRVKMKLVLELTGHHPNAFLLDRKDRILGQAHGRIIGERELGGGQVYVPPSPPDASPEARQAGEEVRWALDELDVTQRSTCVHEALSENLENRAREELEKDIRTRLRQKIKSMRRRMGHIEGDLARIEEAEGFRRYGELLQGAYGQIAKGSSVARVPDYYAEGMPEVQIPLDPAKSLQDNIARYFHQYRRYKDAREQVEERLLETMELIEVLESARGELDAAQDVEALEALRGRLEAQRLLPRRPRSSAPGERGAAKTAPYREFRARSGAVILVGRGAKHNDALTTHVARGRDVWLHARDWAGAHVLLRMDKGGEPKSEDLVDAATLAAHFSRGREDTLVDITHTLAKHVRKPKGFPPGLVTVAGGSTLAIQIDQDRLERLLATEIQT